MDKKSFEVRCTWNVLDGKTISEAVTWTDGSESPDIEDSIQAENCVLLEAPNEDDSNSECRILFFCQPPYLIQQVTVLCESRLLEVYGLHAEYMKTVRNKLIDEVDDMIVFRGEAKLERPTNEASIKFTGLKSKSSMWLYGVKVIAVPAGMPSPTSLLFNGATDETRNNNLQFNSFMNSLFPQAQPPLMPQQHQQWPTPAIGPQSHMGMAGGIMPPQMSHPMLQALLNAQSQQQQPQQSDLAALLGRMSQPAAASMAQQQQNFAPLLAALMGASSTHQPVMPTPISPPTSHAQPQEVKQEAQPVQAQPIPAEPVPLPKPITPPVTPAVTTLPATAQSTTTVTTSSAKTTPVADKPAEPEGDKLRELAFELRPETVDQITEAVVTNVDCSIENLEARLWGKIVQRLSDMESRIMRRMEEIVEALREAEEEEEEDIREVMEEELEDEEEEDLKI